VDCIADLGFVAPLTTGTVYNPSNTPAAGTQTLFDEPGTVTAPPSGSVFTWYAYQSSYSYVVTAEEAERSAVTTEGVGATATQVGVTTTGTGGATSTGSGTGSSGSTSKSSTARNLRPAVAVILGSVVVFGVSFSL
jgi:hypothetical protein